MLLTELWDIILRLLDHETLIIMDQVSSIIKPKTINLILQERRLKYPRKEGQTVFHQVPFKHTFIYDCPNIVLAYLIKTRTNLVKGDIIRTYEDYKTYNNLVFEAIDDGQNLIVYYRMWIGNIVLPKVFDFIKDNVATNYWLKTFDTCTINQEQYKQQCIDNVKYDPVKEICFTTFKFNKIYKLICDSHMEKFINELQKDNLYCYIDDDLEVLY
jgi:hypothetical protein